MNLSEFIFKLETLKAQLDIPLLIRAYQFSEKAHSGQMRKSGDPFLYHGLETGVILAEQNLDSATLAAALIHDVVEDTIVTLDQIKAEFGPEIAELVDGVTKIGELQFKSEEEGQVEYFRKLLVSMAKDIRVILIKLADRLHNMRTLRHLAPEQIHRIAQETLDIYAPLAHRLGMGKIKEELEELSFRYLEPQTYQELEQKIKASKAERESLIKEVSDVLKKELEKAGVKAEISGRAKHLYSTYQKIKRQNIPLEKIYDLMAIRILVENDKDCYQTLSVIHNLWEPIPERFRNYIDQPKNNLYQALHTTVIGPGRQGVEIQIRTQQMHQAAEYGIAAHWLYKEGKKIPDQLDRRLAWIKELLEMQKELKNPAEFLEYLKLDLFQEEIYVFTPKGDLMQLPGGSTPLDFAFVVHTDIGYHCRGAKVNGKMVPLNTTLNNGDKVEILTSSHQIPHQDWLKIVKTSRAKTRIKQWLKQKETQKTAVTGKKNGKR